MVIIVVRRIKITRRLEELFGLDASEQIPTTDISEEITPDPVDDHSMINPETLATIEKVEQALPQVKGLEKSDDELDELSKLAKDAFNNLLDLGMQVDSRFSAEIFNSASSMLGHAITAKTAKVNKKLRMIDLQLKKADLDRKIAQAAEKAGTPETPLGQAQVIDRNELLKQLVAQAKTAEKDK